MINTLFVLTAEQYAQLSAESQEPWTAKRHSGGGNCYAQCFVIYTPEEYEAAFHPAPGIEAQVYEGNLEQIELDAGILPPDPES